MQKLCPYCWAAPGDPHELSCSTVSVEDFRAELANAADRADALDMDRQRMAEQIVSEVLADGRSLDERVTVERNRQARIVRIDEQIAELTAKREALLNPPLAVGDLVTQPDDPTGLAGKTWRVMHVDPIDPRRVSLESIEAYRGDVRIRGNWPTDLLVKTTYRGEVGADGCGCPITAELTTANGSEVDGTQRTEHRSKCWAVAQ